MAGRRFEVADVVEVLQHWQAGQSVRHLARSLGVGRDRVRAIIGAAWLMLSRLCTTSTTTTQTTATPPSG